MPPRVFALLLTGVITAAGLTLAALHGTGLPLGWVGLAALCATVLVRLA
ncbi:MAG: hypothetical protein LBE86_08475 [Gemmobacter sp.]|jgi:hypothetical protein|nr:hypothetical protein [Gemmobacter sp.]